MSARAIRTVAVLFGLSLMLTACDPSEVMRLVSDQLVEQQAAAAHDAGDDAGQDDTAATDDADTDADADADADADTATPDDEVADTGDATAEDGKSEAREFQCRRRGSPKRDAATNNDAAAEQPADTADKPSDTDTEADRPKKKRRSGDDQAPAKDRPSNDAPADDAPGDDGSSAGVSDIERKIFDTLNATRRQAGLQALTLRADISDGARKWSCEMARSGNFRHADLSAAGVNGENIAWGYRTAADVHEGWMNSDGHRRNRLRANWTQYGIGVCTDDAGRRHYTERFR